MSNNKTRTGNRTMLLKTGAIISIIIIVTNVFLINQTPSGSHGRTVLILIAIVGSLTFLTFFAQLRQNKPSDNTDNTQ